MIIIRIDLYHNIDLSSNYVMVCLPQCMGEGRDRGSELAFDTVKEDKAVSFR